jgi:hypothetical protein
MDSNKKIELADLVLKFIAEEPGDSPDSLKMVGHLAIQTGINGFKPAVIGTPVFESKDRYVIILETLNGDKALEVAYYKKTLAPSIDFL